MPMFVKMGNGGTGFLGHPSSSKRAAQRRLNRRHTLPGFPWSGSFSTKSEVDNYLEGDRENIVCLLCGRTMRRLHNHLKAVHGIGDDVYRHRYGLPLSRGLLSLAAQEAHRKAIDTAEQKAVMRRLSAEFQHLAADATRGKQQYIAPYRAEVARSNGRQAR